MLLLLLWFLLVPDHPTARQCHPQESIFTEQEAEIQRGEATCSSLTASLVNMTAKPGT